MMQTHNWRSTIYFFEQKVDAKQKETENEEGEETLRERKRERKKLANREMMLVCILIVWDGSLASKELNKKKNIKKRKSITTIKIECWLLNSINYTTLDSLLADKMGQVVEL